MINDINNRFLILFVLSFFLFFSCSSSCSDQNDTINKNNDLNHQNNINENKNNKNLNNNSNVTENTNNNTKPNNSNKDNNQIENINNSNNPNIENINNINNQTENQNTNNNNIDPSHCLSPEDYTGEDAPTWLIKDGYISRTFCRASKLNEVYVGDEDTQISLFPETCNEDSGCELPEIEEIESPDGQKVKSLTATVSNIIFYRPDPDDNRFQIGLRFFDNTDTFEVGAVGFGGDRNRLITHVPSEAMIGKKFEFIERDMYLVSDGLMIFSSVFIKDPETGKLIFGSVARDNEGDTGRHYSDLLPADFNYKGLFRYTEDGKICDEDNTPFSYFNNNATCFKSEIGDLLVETDKGKFVIPSQSEGDILLGDDRYGIVVSFVKKNTANYCRPEDAYDYESYGFYIFDRNYFVPNPDYTPEHPQCNTLE